MLRALEEGVKGGVWFRLIDKVYAPANLEAAWKKVQANNGAAGVDGQSVQDLLKQGYTWVVDADLKSYFDSIPHEQLMLRVRERIADGRVLQLIETFLKANVMDGLKRWEPEAGAPQGA